MNKSQFKDPLTSTYQVGLERWALDSWSSDHQVKPHWSNFVGCCKSFGANTEISRNFVLNTKSSIVTLHNAVAILLHKCNLYFCLILERVNFCLANMFHFNIFWVKSFDIFRNTQNSLFATYDVSRCEIRSQWKYEYYMYYISLVLLILNGTARTKLAIMAFFYWEEIAKIGWVNFRKSSTLQKLRIINFPERYSFSQIYGSSTGLTLVFCLKKVKFCIDKQKTWTIWPLHKLLWSE